MNKLLFELEDIKSQLSDTQFKEAEHIVYMARNSGVPQEFKVGSGKRIAVFPSGKLYTIKENVVTCKTCGQPNT